MILRRKYIPGRRYAWYFHPEIKTYHDMMEFSANNPHIDVDFLDNATYFFDEMSKEEQYWYWRNCYSLVMNETRWVLDNLDNMCEFKVWWNYYGKKKTIGQPPELFTESSAKDPKYINHNNIYK